MLIMRSFLRRVRRGDILRSLNRGTEALESYCVAADAQPSTRAFRALALADSLDESHQEGQQSLLGWEAICLTQQGVLLRQQQHVSPEL
jgi:hypothetical protein